MSNLRLKIAAVFVWLFLSGCAIGEAVLGAATQGVTSAGGIECAAGEELYCAEQLKAEEWLNNNVLDKLPVATRADLVHQCVEFDQCPFSLPGRAEAGDWDRLVILDIGPVGVDR